MKINFNNHLKSIFTVLIITLISLFAFQNCGKVNVAPLTENSTNSGGLDTGGNPDSDATSCLKSKFVESASFSTTPSTAALSAINKIYNPSLLTALPLGKDYFIVTANLYSLANNRAAEEYNLFLYKNQTATTVKLDFKINGQISLGENADFCKIQLITGDSISNIYFHVYCFNSVPQKQFIYQYSQANGFQQLFSTTGAGIYPKDLRVDNNNNPYFFSADFSNGNYSYALYNWNGTHFLKNVKTFAPSSFPNSLGEANAHATAYQKANGDFEVAMLELTNNMNTKNIYYLLNFNQQSASKIQLNPTTTKKYMPLHATYSKSKNSLFVNYQEPDQNFEVNLTNNQITENLIKKSDPAFSLYYTYNGINLLINRTPVFTMEFSNSETGSSIVTTDTSALNSNPRIANKKMVTVKQTEATETRFSWTILEEAPDCN